MMDEVYHCDNCGEVMTIGAEDFCIAVRTTSNDMEDYFCSYLCLLTYYATDHDVIVGD